MSYEGVVTVWDGTFGLVACDTDEAFPVELILDADRVANTEHIEVGDEIEFEVGEGSQGWFVAEIQ